MFLRFVSDYFKHFKGDFGVETQNFFSSSYQTINFLSEQLDTAENSTLVSMEKNTKFWNGTIMFYILLRFLKKWNFNVFHTSFILKKKEMFLLFQLGVLSLKKINVFNVPVDKTSKWGNTKARICFASVFDYRKRTTDVEWSGAGTILWLIQFLIRVFDIICRILNLIYNCIFDITGVQNAKSKDSSTTKSYWLTRERRR